jgi:ubiquinone/menaquinone biosynthesis C-methylase UbiE/predicted N-acetyltransferase YhbS
MHSHPSLDEASLARIGIWEEAGEIVAVAHYESRLGEAFFELHPGYTHLKPRLLEYAEDQLAGRTESGERYLHAFVNDFDLAFEAEVRSRGYEKDERHARPMSQLPIAQPFRPLISLPDGFRLKSLADDNDLGKIHRVLWRGFNHAGEPPANGIEGRRKMQSGPHFRKDLTLVVEAPNGEFVSYCGLWYEAKNQIAYVEPMATDPTFRRMGLGRAALLEGVRRCAELGARAAFVGSDQLFYQALGFRTAFISNCWIKPRVRFCDRDESSRVTQTERTRLFDRWAEDYDATLAPAGFPFDGYDRVLDEVVRLAEVKPRMQVLDLGIGTGNLAIRFVQAGCAVWGMDFSAEMLTKARAKLPNGVLLQADLLGDWPMELQRRFDRVVSAYVLHEFDLGTKVRLLHRIAAHHLAAGGRIVIADIAFASVADRAQASQQWADSWDADEFYWAADEAGAACARVGLHVTYRQISSCGGVFTLTLGEADLPALLC